MTSSWSARLFRPPYSDMLTPGTSRHFGALPGICYNYVTKHTETRVFAREF